MKAQPFGYFIVLMASLMVVCTGAAVGQQEGTPAEAETATAQEGTTQDFEGSGAMAAGIPRYPDVVLLVVVPERLKPFEGTGKTTAAETELIKALTSVGYRCVDQAQAASVRDWSVAGQVMADPTGAQARSLVERFGAHVLIIGRGFGEPASRFENLYTARGLVEVRVLVPPTGEILLADSVTESGADAAQDLATTKALAAAARRLAPKILGCVGELTGGPTEATTVASETATEDAGAGAPGRRLRVAFAPFDDRSGWTGGDWNLSAALPDLIAQELMKLDIVEVVDRANLSQTLGEQALDISGLVDRSEEPRELGTLLPADVLVVGRVTMFQSKKQTVAGGLLD
ncbi:MAG: CsgG/HfaB family protein, partial [Armatimonadetes bacterium]|nr:CsgG/HfaB family protein [Armatimonadota bacterium]